MSDDGKSAGPFCACNRVEYRPRAHPDRSFSERWLCRTCGSEFVRKGAASAAKIPHADALCEATIWDEDGERLCGRPVGHPELHATLECDYCGGAAATSDDHGMFEEADEATCLTCGGMGHISADEGTAYWALDTCRHGEPAYGPQTCQVCEKEGLAPPGAFVPAPDRDGGRP